MALVYRTAGAWGGGLGSNLSAAQVDENFYTLSQALAAIVIPDGVGIADITVSGSQMTVHLTDASTLGPFQLPVAAFRFLGEWSPGTGYVFLDIFSVADDGLYLVLRPYEAPTEFDPNASDTDGTVLQKVFSLASQAVMAIEAFTDDHTFALGDAGKYLRFTKAVEVFFTIPLNATLAIPIGTVATASQAGAGKITVDPHAGVTVNTPETLSTRKQRSVLSIIKVGTDEWDLSGDLELA